MARVSDVIIACESCQTLLRNVRVQLCHTYSWQKWYIVDERIISLYDGKCLEANIVTGNVDANWCHDSSNQKWYADSSNRLRSKYDNRCLDQNIFSDNLYMNTCHDQDDQKFAPWHGSQQFGRGQD